MRKPSDKHLAWAATAAALVALAALAGCGDKQPPDEPAAGSTVTVPVTRVVDGDTIEVALDGRTEDVRYIGVDTPESVAPGEPVECFGRRASEFNRRLVEGERVALTFDDELRDRYGRLLAYVRLDGLLVNAELVRRGLARTLEIEPNTEMAPRLARLQRRAGALARGLWSACGA